ncbi:Zinc finger protein 106 [Camponotus floridanus]|uniref:Zinc finger protein 106 n=1 Tax=Camponotus floridanus TaxID=104421 RepID=E2A409_CAMFO|nr:Zinc finger protein 106 [Camponotus floridanus]
MSYTNFGRGRGFGRRGSRATASSFGRPRFLPPPFRHVGPPRPGRPFMPWQPNNMFFQPHLLRGNPQFRPGGRRKNFCGHNTRLPAPNRLPVPPDYEDVIISPDLSSLQIENNQTEATPQIPLPGSEEERQQKIAETADRLKQKLSCFSSSEMRNIWSDDKPFSSNFAEDDCINNINIAELRYQQVELSLISHDLTNIDKVNPDDSRLDNTQYMSNDTNNTNTDMVILEENENESQLATIPNNQMTNLSVENEYLEMDNWLHESVDNLEQSDLHKDHNVESELLDSDLQCQFNTPLINIPQDCCDQQQDISQGNEIYSTSATIEQDVSKTSSLQNIPLPTDLTDQDILQTNVSQSEQELVTTNLEVQENILESQVPTISSSSNNCTLSQSTVVHASVLNNITSDNQVPKIKKNSFHSGPPKLSPHTEQGELPVDFDPSTPPPILMKQDESRVMPPPPVSDVLPLFNPTEPPPNIRHLLKSTSKEIPMWNNINVQNSAPTTYNRETYTELNTNGGFISQQLPLESQSNVFLPPHIDTIQFSPRFSVPSGSCPVIDPNVSSRAIFPTRAMSHNTYASSSPSSELLPLSDCNTSKDDGLNDMQEALKFAEQMTSITEKREKESSSKSLCESSTIVNSISNVESISLPPGEPKTKTNTLKRTKRNDIHNKKISQEQRVSDHLPLEEMVVQDARSMDMSLINEQERPKVVFNLNNKTKIVTTRAGWRENTEKRNGIKQFMESEKTPSISKKNFESTLKRNEEERKNLKKNENNSGNTASSESIANQNTVSSHKKIQKNANAEKSLANISLSSKINMQKSMSCAEKNENSTSETSWKNKIISRFLKMSKNDIFNMVNNTSLRKFDVIMKRLVKEKKSSLSLEMRHAENEKMKLYDQQEFMKQLNTMLETDATVSVTDLPTEFIHHLNEVLQLDVQLDNQVESATAATSSSQNSHLEDPNHVFSPVRLFISEYPNRTAHNYINQECERNKGHMIKTGHDRDTQMQHHISRSNDFNLKDDTCSTIVSNKSSLSSKLSALQHDLDDIFSEVTKKNQTPAAIKERKYCNVNQRNAKKFDDDAITRSAENDTPLEDDRMRKSENCARWIERCDKWKRKEREDPHAYRNLTKEEWEARYGTQADSISSSSFTKKINTNKNPSHRGHKKSYPRRRHSSESSKHIRITRHRTLEKDKHKKSRRHSDDRRHSAGYSEYNNDNNDRNEDNTSSSSSNSNSSSRTSRTSNSTNSSSSSSSNDSNGNTEPNVTKLLRAIKEKEKVAKKMSLNETIRDEVNAEIERERKQKSRKSRKYKKWRKEKKLHHKKKKKKQQQSKKATNFFDSASDKDENEEITKLLTENEIKKEMIENEMTQEVIVKEELDISQENTRDAEFANASHVENKTMRSLPESKGTLESSLLTTQETPLTTVNQSHIEDRPPTASPTQLKTKAQLKQMPEAADTNDNKIFLKIFTTLPEDWNTINPTECSENSNKSYQVTDINCNRDETDVPAIDNFTSNIKNCEHLRESSNENAISRQSDVCTSSDSCINATKIKDDNNISISANISDKAASTSAVASDVPIRNVSRKSRGASKKIDIKTYYERTIHRRMNVQEESKKFAENPTTSTQDLSSSSKIVKPEIPINKSASTLTCDGSIQDPRLFSAARLATISCQINSQDNEIAVRNDVRQEERQTMKTTKITKIASKSVEENLNRVTDTVEKIHQDTSKDKHPFIANTNVNVLSNVTTNTISSKSNTGNVMDKKLQSRAASDSKKFKNIRSEGSKELKLKKEITKPRKTKKKPEIALKSISLLPTKIYYPLVKTTENANEVSQEKKVDNASDNRMKIEQIANPCESKINNNCSNNANKMKVSTIFSENTDNNNELSQGVDEAKESFSSAEFIGEENIEKDVGNNIESTDSPETRRNEEAHNVESANNTASIEVTNKEEQNTREIFNVVSKPDASAASIEISTDIVKAVQEDISTSDKEFNATNDATEFLDQIQVEKSNNQDLSESMDNDFEDTLEKGDMSSIPELDMTPRQDIIDDTPKDQPLINTNVVNDVEINDSKENNMKSIVDSTCKSASAEEDNSLPRKTVELSSASIESSTQQPDTGNGVISPESVGSPFKGFLPETMIDFEQPDLFNLELHEKDKLFLNDCNVNHATREEEAKIAKQQNYESLECNCANNMSINENFNVTFGDTLLASDKERATSDKSGLMADENIQGQIVEKSSCEIVTAALHEDDNIDGEGDEADKGLISESQLTIKDSMFINEEEMIQDENGSKDLTSKLTTTTDPSLSDALDDAAISDDALRLAETQSAEHLNNHNMYLEANISTEKISCDKLPGFDSDEHLDNDMFYLDDRLQSAATFDNKDEASFSIHQETSPRYDIIPPTVTSEPTLTTSCADLSPDEIQEERYKFDLKPISSTDSSDLLARVPSMEHSPIVIDTPPRTLNIPTKAALKEAATSHFLKSPNNSLIKETTQGILEKTQQSETESASYQTPAWHVDIYQGTKTHSLDTHTNNCVNVNTISSTQNNTHNERVHINVDVDQSKTLVTSLNNDKDLRSSDIQHNPVVELRKMKELDSRMTNQKKAQEKTREDVYKGRRKRNGTLLHKLKNKRQMKYRSQRIDLNRNSLTRKLKNMKHLTGAVNSREAILARMLEIDLEMHKLTAEKLKLHEMLQSNVESAVTNNEATRENDMISDQIGVVSTLTSQLPQNTKVNSAKRKKHHSSSSKQSPIKRKKIVPRSSEDDEIIRYTQKKMPVIKWKKTPRLEYIINRQKEDLEEENNLDETEQPLTTFANKEVNISSVLDTSEDATIQKPESNTPEDATIRKPESNAFEDVSEDATMQKLESNATIDHDVQVQETTENHEKANCDVIDESLKPAIDRSSLDKSADNHTEDSTEREHAKCFDIDKRNDISIPSKAANSQPASVQLRSTPESLSIYSDDSTWDFLVQNTASEVQENRNVTGLVLLDEKLKKEQARSRKLKAIVRKKKKEQLNNYLKRVNNLTMEEEELPLSKLYIRKLRQKRDLLDSLSQRKEDANVDVDPEVLKNVDDVINAVAENRVENLYEPQTQNVSDIPTTSNLLSQPEEHQFYVDAEAANSDWPCREKENIEEAAERQQDSNNAPTNDESNHVFKVVNQNKTPFHDEHNVEPDSSVTPEETLIESHSLDCDVPPKDNVALRNFDIRVSVPKILIKDDFSLGLLQKFKDTEGGVVGTGLVDSTTNVLATTNSEKSIEKNEDTSLTVKSIQVVQEDKRKEESETNLIEEKDKQAVDVSDGQNKACELQKDETINNVRDTQNAPQSNTTKSEYTNTIENEDTGDSVASNNKVTMANVTNDSSVSDPIVEKVNAREKKSDTESEQLSCDAIALKQDSRDAKNANAKEKERNDNPESGSRVFEAIMDNDQNTRSSVSIDRASEKSEESTDTSVFSFDKITAKGTETSKSRSRKKSGMSAPVRRSTRYTNENVKATDSNSNSSEQLNVHERDLTQCRSGSPSWTMRDEKILNNIKRNRAAQKTQSIANRKVSIIDCETKTDQAKSRLSAEPASSKNKTPINAKKRKHTEWQMMNCKVRLIDCKHTMFKQNVNREILDKLGIIAINRFVSSDISHMQCATYNQDMAVIPAATSEQSSHFLSEKSCDKKNTEIEILDERPIKQNNDDDSAQGAASMEVDEEEEAMKMQYTVHKGPILDIKIFENSFLAASEDGKIYRYSQTSNGILNIYKGHKSAVTCLHIYKSEIGGANKEVMYSGSLDGTLRCYNIMTGALIKNPVQINSPIQCMDQSWGMIFIGTKSGHVSRFHIKASSIKGSSIEFSDKSVLALKATNEGARRILIVASRNQPITIRDAQTGLFLRTISGQKNHTVYSLMRHNNLIYCGTSSTSINVFDFTTGEQTIQYDAGVGIVCMRLHGQLLFAGCYDGNIYVFDTRNHKLVCSIPGPGNMLLSIEVVNNKIIAGSKDKRLHSWQMPIQVRALL